MARISVILTVLAATAVVALFAAPTPESQLEELTEYEVKAEDHLRFRRVTCDLLSFKGVVGDSACAANCLSMGKAGGRCNKGICQCRKTKFSDLWKNRFGG